MSPQKISPFSLSIDYQLIQTLGGGNQQPTLTNQNFAKNTSTKDLSLLELWNCESPISLND